jgi:hypothetical protein
MFLPGIVPGIVKNSLDGDCDNCDEDSKRIGYAAIAVFIGLLVIISVALLYSKIPPQTKKEEKSGEFVASVVCLGKNYPFMTLIPPWLLDRVSA